MEINYYYTPKNNKFYNTSLILSLFRIVLVKEEDHMSAKGEEQIFL